MGTLHRYHPPIASDGLADNCERCTEIAMHPFACLDDENLAAIAWRIEKGEPPRSKNEALAMFQVREAWKQLKRLMD